MAGKNQIGLNEIDGKKFAVILWAKKENGHEDVSVFVGKAKLREGRLIAELNHSPEFEIIPEWHSRIKKVSQDIKDIVQGADYCVSLAVGDLPKNIDSSKLKATGLIWPK